VGPVGPFPDATISSLQTNMGTVFLRCNNAVTALGMELEGKAFGAMDDIIADLEADVEPGVHRIPAMVIANEKAQAAGIAYNKQ